MQSVVFLCVANSARSQMAEGLARSKAPDGWEVFSAGSRPGALHPLAIQVMQEIGIDVSGYRSKGFGEVPIRDADVVVTLCAEQECPVAATTGERLAWPLPDPAVPTDADPLVEFRSVRDEIARRLDRFFSARGTVR